MKRATHGRVDEDAGLRPRNFIVNLIALASFHSGSPTAPSITGAAEHDPDRIVLGSSGSWTRRDPRSRVRSMDCSTGRFVTRFHLVVAVALLLGARQEPEKLWVAAPHTEEGAFTPGIEGPACDKDGAVYA